MEAADHRRPVLGEGIIKVHNMKVVQWQNTVPDMCVTKMSNMPSEDNLRPFYQPQIDESEPLLLLVPFENIRNQNHNL